LKFAKQIVNNHTSGELSYSLCFSNQTDQEGDETEGLEREGFEMERYEMERFEREGVNIDYPNPSPT
jgi:hypothetical protein